MRSGVGASDPRFMFVVGNIYSLPFAQGAFDTVAMVRVLHHLTQPLSALRDPPSARRQRHARPGIRQQAQPEGDPPLPRAAAGPEPFYPRPLGVCAAQF